MFKGFWGVCLARGRGAKNTRLILTIPLNKVWTIPLNKVWVHTPSIDIKYLLLPSQYSSIPLFLTHQFHHQWTCTKKMSWTRHNVSDKEGWKWRKERDVLWSSDPQISALYLFVLSDRPLVHRVPCCSLSCSMVTNQISTPCRNTGSSLFAKTLSTVLSDTQNQ